MRSRLSFACGGAALRRRFPATGSMALNHSRLKADKKG
jgi:hypothetical protein